MQEKTQWISRSTHIPPNYLTTNHNFIFYVQYYLNKFCYSNSGIQKVYSNSDTVCCFPTNFFLKSMICERHSSQKKYNTLYFNKLNLFTLSYERALTSYERLLWSQNYTILLLLAQVMSQDTLKQLHVTYKFSYNVDNMCN